ARPESTWRPRSRMMRAKVGLTSSTTSFVFSHGPSSTMPTVSPAAASVCAATAPAAPEPTMTTSNASSMLRVRVSPSTTVPSGRSSSLCCIGVGLALQTKTHDRRLRRVHLRPQALRLRVEQRAHRLEAEHELADGVDRAREQALEHAHAIV